MTNQHRTAADPLNPAQLLRNEFLQDISSAILSRLSHPEDLAPIVIRSHQNLFSVEQAIRRTCYMADIETITIRMPWIIDPRDKLIVRNFIQRSRRQRRVLCLTDWNNADERQPQVLKQIAAERDPEVIIVICANGDSDDDPDMEVGKIFGKKLWQDMTYIEIDLPKVIAKTKSLPAERIFYHAFRTDDDGNTVHAEPHAEADGWCVYVRSVNDPGNGYKILEEHDVGSEEAAEQLAEILAKKHLVEIIEKY